MVETVARGTVLAGRYRVLEPLDSDLVGSSSWTANDQILDRPVRVRVLVSGNVAQALDSARRAALVSDPRLIRVLDVGSAQDVSYVVTEQVSGPSLEELVAAGPLAPDQARAIIGEAAAALEVARRRGVHHLALRPSVLHVTPEGRVLLTGLAFDGALLGAGLGDARSTTRADTVGLVRLLYAALTGRWPVTEQDPEPTPGTLPVAPLGAAGPVPPAELSPGIPADLDTLCAVTLGANDDGPHSPAELVRELEPWGAVRPAGAALPGAASATGATGAAAVAPSAISAPGVVQRQSVRSTFEEQRVAGTDLPGTPPPAQPRPTFAPVSGAAAAPPVVRPAPPVAALQPPVIGPPTAAPPTHPHPPTFPPGPPPTGPTRVSAAAPSSGSARAAAGGFGLPFEDVVRSGPVEPLAERRFDPTKIVLALVVVAVLIGVVIAFNALLRPVSGRTDQGAAPVAGASSSPSSAASPSASASTTPSLPATPAGAPISVATATTIDPSDTDGEHEELAARAIDGDPATLWYTQTYKQPNFSGIKAGVGFVLHLTAPATVTRVTLHVNGTGGGVEVRATDASAPQAGPALASGPLSADTVLTLSTPTKTQSIVLWFTSLAQTADGSNRIEISEITVS